MTDWLPGRWWRVIDGDDMLWCETSNEAEARAAVRPRDKLQQLYIRYEFSEEWRDAETS